jgi:HSP20 family protein
VLIHRVERDDVPQNILGRNGHMNSLMTRGWLEPSTMFRELGSLHHDLDTLFGSVFGNRDDVDTTTDWAPRIESFVKDDALHVRVDLPGVDPKAVEVSLDDDVLTISGERKSERTEPTYREVTYGRFERRIRVPDGVETDKIAAKYEHGVLHVTVPLPKPVNRKVNVEIASNGA